jgi:hypothetical protein
MPGPSLTFGLILATLFGAGFHLIVGGDIRRLALFLLVSWFGFGLGQIAGMLFEIDVLILGPLHLAAAVGGSFAALGITHILTIGQRRTRRRRRNSS